MTPELRRLSVGTARVSRSENHPVVAAPLDGSGSSAAAASAGVEDHRTPAWEGPRGSPGPAFLGKRPSRQAGPAPTSRIVSVQCRGLPHCPRRLFQWRMVFIENNFPLVSDQNLLSSHLYHHPWSFPCVPELLLPYYCLFMLQAMVVFSSYQHKPVTHNCAGGGCTGWGVLRLAAGGFTPVNSS